VAASLLPGLLSYYPVDQFAAAPPLPGTPAGAGLAVEAWAPNKLRAGAPPFAAPTWHLPCEAEARLPRCCLARILSSAARVVSVLRFDFHRPRSCCACSRVQSTTVAGAAAGALGAACMPPQHVQA